MIGQIAAHSTSALPDAILADLPLGYWRMGEPVGATTMNDSSGNARHGSYLNGVVLGVPGLTVGGVDTAAQFTPSGSNSPYCFVPDDNSLDGLSGFTVEAMIQTSAAFPKQIAARDDTTSIGRSFQFAAISGGQLQFVKIAGTIVAVTSTGTVNNGAPRHVAATYDGATIKLYIDGAQDGSAAATGTLGTSGTGLRIGARRNTTPVTTDYFTGIIDEVAVYNYALSAARIAAHAAAART